MKQKRSSFVVFMCFLFILSMTACRSSKSFTFQIDNGERIKVTLNTADGYDLTQENGTVTIQKDQEDILSGTFLSSEGYDTYVATITSSDDVHLISATPENAPTFYLYQFEGEAGTETTMLFKIEGAETGALFSSLSSREEAETAFDRLQFEKLG